MRYLIDTSVISALFDETHPHHHKCHEKLSQLNRWDEFMVSILSIFEFEYSFFGSRDPKTQANIRKTIEYCTNHLQVLNLQLSEAQTFGRIKAHLKAQKNISSKNMRRHNVDLMLASTAILNNCVLVSGDNIFFDVAEIHPDFRFQNWFKP